MGHGNHFPCFIKEPVMEKLPEYSSGIEIYPATRKCVKVSVTKVTNEMVCGVVKVPAIVPQRPVISIQLRFQEAIQKTKSEGTKRTVVLDSILHTSIDEMNQGLEYHVPFTLWFKRLECRDHISEHAYLPPSFQSFDGCAKIDYSIYTTIASGDKVIQEHAQSFLYQPDNPPWLLPETAWASGKQGRNTTTLSIKKIPILDTKTTIALKVQMTNPQNFQISFKILSHTVCSTTRLKYVPNINQPTLHTCTRQIAGQTLDVKPHWQHGNKTVIHLPIMLEPDSQSFSTCVTTHRHTLCVSVNNTMLQAFVQINAQNSKIVRLTPS